MPGFWDTGKRILPIPRRRSHLAPILRDQASGRFVSQSASTPKARIACLANHLLLLNRLYEVPTPSPAALLGRRSNDAVVAGPGRLTALRMTICGRAHHHMPHPNGHTSAITFWTTNRLLIALDGNFSVTCLELPSRAYLGRRPRPTDRLGGRH
jgi:hypothetical protein